MTTFTEAQSQKAVEVVLELMREKRFYLYPNKDSLQPHILDREVFGAAYELQDKIEEIYLRAKISATAIITSEERKLGITPPKIKNHQSIVTCSNYSGGMEICEIYLLADFLAYKPKSFEELEAELFEMREGKIEDIVPSQLQEKKERNCKLAIKIWNDIQQLNNENNMGEKFLVLLKSKFHPSDGYSSDDFFEGCLQDMLKYPHGMGHLFYKYMQEHFVVRHNFIVFNSNRSGHVVVEKWSSGVLGIRFGSTGGYSTFVYTVLIM